MDYKKYIPAIEDDLSIVDKNQQEVSFILNSPQRHFIENMKEKNIILKARQKYIQRYFSIYKYWIINRIINSI